MAKGEKITDVGVYHCLIIGLGGFCAAPRKITFDNRVFIFNYEQTGEVVHFWIHLIGTPEEAKNYSYTLEFHGKKPHIYNVYSGEVISVDESTAKIIESNKCFGMKFKVYKEQFLGGELLYPKHNISIGIKNMKDEAKDDFEESGVSDNDN